ncbi:MAG: PAS domain-containing protein, partial [Actinobacteria bacterium]
MTAGNRKSQASPELASLLEYLRTARGFDFTGYKTASLERRISKRVKAVGCDGYVDYQDYLEANPGEFTELFNTILINVTAFFRDREAWDYVASDVIPRMLADIPESETIRVWSAGCASGEEAYSAAILLAGALGGADFRRRVKIYATDIDDEALAAARQAMYPVAAVKDLPMEIVEKYFEPNAGGLVFRPDLRRSVIFGRNDLVQDAPISRVDLLISRNTLMYFTAETQARVLTQFNFSLKDTGYLFLGKSEMLITHSDLFAPHDMKWRVFRKVPRTVLRERMTFAGQPHRLLDLTADVSGRYAQLREGAADVSPVAQIAVDAEGFVVSANQAARKLFELGPADMGRPVQDLEVSYQPVELRTGIQQASQDGQPVDLGRVDWVRPGQPPRVLQVTVVPILGGGEAVLGTSIGFEDVTAFVRLDADHRESRRQLETAYEELQSTVEELETTNEELQSTNEELETTNEELETTNEELQSTNEELETMNEELQSTNDELETMNDEQRMRALELDRLNIFLEGILGNLELAVVVIDDAQQVQLWNPAASEMWGLREDEVAGVHFLSLDIGLPVGQLRDAMRAALGDGGAGTDLVLEAVNRRGRTFECSVRVQPLRADGKSRGAILIMAE